MVTAARTAAACKSPASQVFAGVLVVVLAIIKALLVLAERHRYRLLAAAVQQLDAARTELDGHPLMPTKPGIDTDRARTADRHEAVPVSASPADTARRPAALENG
ncbi:hypothetical protein [Solihabitans fulvus]|uniref:hypothetical protein n=1 Tax=Solihabitans fulvus TaxID=1892852 RepID=UPI00122E0D47|nr:hypothetical protein [Solihabitans fulvus]